MPNTSKIIKIAGVTLLEWGLKITDQTGMVFNLSEKKKDGTTSEAWTQYQNMGLKIGSTVDIWFAESPNSHGSTSRYIRSFREAAGVPQAVGAMPNNQIMENEQIPLPEEAPTQPKGQDQFGRRLALHGFLNARLQNHTIAQVKAEIDELLALEDYINTKL